MNRWHFPAPTQPRARSAGIDPNRSSVTVRFPEGRIYLAIALKPLLRDAAVSLLLIVSLGNTAHLGDDYLLSLFGNPEAQWQFEFVFAPIPIALDAVAVRISKFPRPALPMFPAVASWVAAIVPAVTLRTREHSRACSTIPFRCSMMPVATACTNIPTPSASNAREGSALSSAGSRSAPTTCLLRNGNSAKPSARSPVGPTRPNLHRPGERRR